LEEWFLFIIFKFCHHLLFNLPSCCSKPEWVSFICHQTVDGSHWLP